MGGGFACPECGQAIALQGLTPGREVICPACSTRVEVPYLPRATRRKPKWPLLPGPVRGGRRWKQRGTLPAWKRRLARGGALGAVGVVVLATWWAVGSIGSRARGDRERVLNELIAASAAAAAAGDRGGAFREIEAAVRQARKLDPEGSGRLDALTARRDRIACAEVRGRLAALGKLPIEARAGEARTLAARVGRDPALADLAEPVAAAVEATVTVQVEADRDAARLALDGDRGGDAFRLAIRARDRAARLASGPDAARLRDEAEQIIVAAVERCGATLAAGPTDPFAGPIWAEALSRRGYLLPPADPAWSETWAAHAPFQVSARVVETRDGLYLQSQNRPTQIDGQFAVLVRGRPHWQTRVYAQTRAPIPDLAAFVAGHLATASRREPESERRLRDDARAAFRIMADRNFRGIPAPSSAVAPGPAPGELGPSHQPS